MANWKEEAEIDQVDQVVDRNSILITRKSYHCKNKQLYKSKKRGSRSLSDVRKQEKAHRCILGEWAQGEREHKAIFFFSSL